MRLRASVESDGEPNRNFVSTADVKRACQARKYRKCNIVRISSCLITDTF